MRLPAGNNGPLTHGFNPRTRVGCDGTAAPSARADPGFNPRTRVGCDFTVTPTRIIYGQVSIHAPAWGATRILHHFFEVRKVSIHAPAWGATTSKTFAILSAQVSIHAPAWGATSRRWQAGYPVFCFNPRTRVGCDAANPYLERQTSSFNPRTRVGCDFKLPLDVGIISKFQSTHPRGVRPSR